MGFLIAVVVLLVLGAVIAGAAGLGLFAWGERTRAKAERDAPRFLDSWFDGRETVVVKINLETPSFETAVAGAADRGYDLTATTNNTEDGTAKTLVFTRRPARAPRD